MAQKTVRIGNKLVGDTQPVYSIAEIGINYNGDLNIAKQLIDVAGNSGCDAAKFQKRTVRLLRSPNDNEKWILNDRDVFRNIVGSEFLRLR